MKQAISQSEIYGKGNSRKKNHIEKPNTKMSPKLWTMKGGNAGPQCSDKKGPKQAVIQTS